jgi:hypothetical protein
MQEFKQDRMPEDELKASILGALAASLSAKRREAVSSRNACGIEDHWLGDSEFYEGYDDANRHEFGNVTTKPLNGDGGVSTPKKVSGSTVFPNITQPYCDAASARVGDMLLPTDDRNFGIDPTPIPSLAEKLGIDEEEFSKIGQPGPDGQPPEQQTLTIPGGMQIDAVRAKNEFDRVIAEAQRKAEKAQTQIDDWLQECQYHAELRLAIDDCVQIGTGVIKGPFPVKRRASKWVRDEVSGDYRLEVMEEIKPMSRRVDPWNLFPDPACGENIHDGAFIWERDYLTGKKLEDFIGLPGYMQDQIKACLHEGPKGTNEADNRKQHTEESKKREFEIWYYHGCITAEELRACGCETDGPDDKSYPVMVTMVNDRVIRASLNPLDSGEFPYDLIPWKRRKGMPWGMGVARQMRTPQRMVVAATRNLMDNAGLAAGPQIIVRRGVEPENGIWEIKPLKIWEETMDAEGGVSTPVSAVAIPMLINELQTIIQLGMELAERVTGLPMLLQGQQGIAPNTATGTQIMNNNGNSLLRRQARQFDSCVTEPHIRRYYAWLMAYGDDDDAKGDFQILARGSTALVERDLQSQEMLGIIQLSLNGAYGLDPKKAMSEFLKSRRFDPDAFSYTEEEMKKMQEQQPPPPPIIAVTEMKEQGATQRKQMELDAKTQSEQARLAHEAQENAQDRAIDQWVAQLTAAVEQANMTSEERRAFEDAKVTLSTTAMKLKTQKELNATSQLMTPPTEPAGRAPNGQAFAR